MLTGRLCGGSASIRRPRIQISPSVGATKPPIRLSVVVLPQPGRPEQAEELAVADLEVEARQRDLRAVALDDRAQLDPRGHGRRSVLGESRNRRHSGNVVAPPPRRTYHHADSLSRMRNQEVDSLAQTRTNGRQQRPRKPYPCARQGGLPARAAGRGARGDAAAGWPSCSTSRGRRSTGCCGASRRSTWSSRARSAARTGSAGS